MLTRILKCSSVVALLAAILLRPSAGYVLLTEFLVCAAAIMAAGELFQSRRPALAGIFVIVAAGFNPVLPLGLSQPMFLALAAVSLGMFLLSLVTFRQQPKLSMASITDRTPGSESL